MFKVVTLPLPKVANEFVVVLCKLIPPYTSIGGLVRTCALLDQQSNETNIRRQ